MILYFVDHFLRVGSFTYVFSETSKNRNVIKTFENKQFSFLSFSSVGLYVFVCVHSGRQTFDT